MGVPKAGAPPAGVFGKQQAPCAGAFAVLRPGGAEGAVWYQPFRQAAMVLARARIRLS